MKKLFFYSLALCMMLFFTPYSSQAEVKTASAGEYCAGFDADKIQEIEGFFDTYGVAKEQQQSLINKLCANELWDSMKPSPRPTSIDRTDDHVAHVSEEVYRFADGSIIVAELPIFEKPETNITTRSVSGCNFVSAGSYGGYWKNCKAGWRWGVYNLGFYFDYSNTKEVGASIDSYYNPWHYGVGQISDERLTRLSRNSVSYTANHTVSPLNNTIGFKVVVNGNSAYTGDLW